MPLESAVFEERVRQFFIQKYDVDFESENVGRIIDIQGVGKNFDLVSIDGKHIGDAKYYKSLDNGKSPSAKLSTISEYIWLLEKTNADHKFLVFGNDRRVPELWLKRYKNLTKVRFYFYDGDNLEELN